MEKDLEISVAAGLTKVEKELLIDKIKKIMTTSELEEFNTFTEDEINEYIKGFIDNINEWRNAKESANNPQKGGDDTGGAPAPDDGLNHWKPVVYDNDNDSSNNITDPMGTNIVEPDDIQKQIEEAEKKNKEAGENIKDKDAKDMSESAQQAANAAREAANAAQEAADAAQHASNNVDAKAQKSGNSSDISKADEAQNAADAAQNAADEAQSAAEAAQDAADRAEEALRNGNNYAAADYANKAAKAAQTAVNKSKAAQLNARKALDKNRETEQHFGNPQDGKNSKSNQGEYAHEPVLVSHEPSPNGNQVFNHDAPIDNYFPFDGNDFLDSKELRDKCREIAERAGQPWYGDDFSDPITYGSKKYVEAQEIIDKLGQWDNQSPGSVGNSPMRLKETMRRLFGTSIDWRTKLEEFMTDKTPIDKRDVWSKRRLGVKQDHPFYKGRYQRPRETFEEKRSGIVQVFFLVDASGSMHVRCGDGINVFEHIMSELIQIEKNVNIKRSAYASFSAGPIYRDDVTVWTDADAQDEQELVQQFELPVASGGTSVLDAINSLQSIDFDDIYGPETLLIVVTDGGDSYSGLKELCTDPDQVERMIWIITATGRDWFASRAKELMEQGVPYEHIICVDINTEWGAVIKN